MIRSRYLWGIYLMGVCCLLSACDLKQEADESSQVEISREDAGFLEASEMTKEDASAEASAQEGTDLEATDDFGESAGFMKETPFYVYNNPDGERFLMMYYDEKTQTGGGVFHYGKTNKESGEDDEYTFSFQDVETHEWSGYPIGNYLETTTVLGDSGAGQVKYYVENREYDESGRISHYDSNGVIPGTGLQDYITILSMDFDYHDNGKLKKRMYAHNAYLFSEKDMEVESCFDEQGRLMYEAEYGRDGRLEYYYIYEGDSSLPRYCLVLDLRGNVRMSEFWKYSM